MLPSGANVFLVDPRTIPNFPKGVAPESVWLFKRSKGLDVMQQRFPDGVDFIQPGHQMRLLLPMLQKPLLLQLLQNQ